MKNILLFICLLCFSLSATAQKKDKCSKEEFRAKKTAYLKEKANLTDEEAMKFFPLYFQLEDLKKDINGKAWANFYVNAEIQDAELDKEYLEKFKTVLSAKKIYMVIRAEIKFNRNMLKIIHPDKNKKNK